MLKVVVAGYDRAFINLISGAFNARHRVVGVFRHEKTRFNSFLLFLKDIFAPSKEKSFIKKLKLREINANSINSEKFKKELLKLNPDVLLVGSWSEKIKKDTINLPRLAAINVHPSLLPRHRGPNPYARVIMAGETTTGVTFHLLEENFDTGAILAQEEIPVLLTDTGLSLKCKCTDLMKNMTSKLLNSLEEDIIIPLTQNEKGATYEKQLEEGDLLLDFKNKSAIEIYNQVRALYNFSPCFFNYKSFYLSAESCEILKEIRKEEAGTITESTKASINVVCKDGVVVKLKNVKFLGINKIISAFCLKNFMS